MVDKARLGSVMRLASPVTAFLASAALWLPYAVPALCTTFVPEPDAAHEACGDRPPGSSLVPPTAGTTCDLGGCPTAPTAPPKADLPVLPILPSVDVQQPEPLATVLGEALAPPTPPPQL